MDIFPPARQRPAMLALASILDSRDASLRRDECGDWRISGLRGHLYADRGGTFAVMVCTETARTWSSVKAALSPFASLTQDGDTEGAFRLDRMPTEAEGAALRKALRISKRKRLSEEHVAKLRANLNPFGMANCGAVQ